MTMKQVLRKAIRLINGYAARGVLVSRHNGKACYCIEGAIMRACGFKGEDLKDGDTIADFHFPTNSLVEKVNDRCLSLEGMAGKDLNFWNDSIEDSRKRTAWAKDTLRRAMKGLR